MTRIVILAKAPVPSFAKTRLIPELGEKRASSLAATMLQHTVREALLADVGEVELCVSPSRDHPAWQRLSLPSNIRWSEQASGDLGVRMAGAAERVLAKQESVLMIGTDCPSLKAETLRQASAALRHDDAVVIPAHDGGYVLMGLNRFHSSLYSGIPWSTAEVFSITMDRLTQLGWTVRQFPPSHDIDMPEDLSHLPEHWGYSVSNLIQSGPT